LKDPNVGAKMKITKKGNEAHSLAHNTLWLKKDVLKLRDEIMTNSWAIIQVEFNLHDQIKGAIGASWT